MGSEKYCPPALIASVLRLPSESNTTATNQALAEHEGLVPPSENQPAPLGRQVEGDYSQSSVISNLVLVSGLWLF